MRFPFFFGDLGDDIGVADQVQGQRARLFLDFRRLADLRPVVGDGRRLDDHRRLLQMGQHGSTHLDGCLDRNERECRKETAEPSDR